MVVMRVALCCSLLVLLAGCAPPPTPPDPQLWGSLKPGPYAVGFGLRWETDPSRTYGLEKDGTKKPRPIPVGVWYPARPSPAEHMQVADYFDMRSKQTQFDDLAVKLNVHIGSIVAQTMGSAAAMNRVLAMRTSATFDAPPAKGQFPVVIYCSESSYQEDFVLFEYLASQGYVVLSTSYHSTDLSNVAAIDLGVRFQDMLFLHRFAALLGNADASHLAAMGDGLGAQTVMVWALERDTPLDAVATLDYTERFWSGTGVLPPNLDDTVPTLQFASAPPAHSPQRKAPQFRAIEPGLQHEDFVTTGILREAARPHRNEYDHVCRVTLLFLDAYLKRSPSAKGELQQFREGHAKTTPSSSPPYSRAPNSPASHPC